MGIPRLKGHLLRYEETVWLGNSNIHNEGDARNITSVVIDGPALVYHVYYCVMATMEQHLNPFSAQPSSDEVSTGVMKVLLHLRDIGVTVEKIYFDGALPDFKRKVRIERMGRSALKLEQACHSKERGFKGGTAQRGRATLDTNMLFSRSPISPKFHALPENPFMVATVVEDLKYRWDWKSIRTCICASSQTVSDPTLRPWEDTTEVVFGEADLYCAETARELGSAVLTGDSDFLVHDLGPNGSVIFFDSIERVRISNTKDQLPSWGIRATEMCPAKIAKQMGVNSLQRVAYELKQDPYLKFSSLVELAKSDKEKREGSSYDEFLNEYMSPAYRMPKEGNQSFPLLDSKVSELVAQYYHPLFDSSLDLLYVYLPVLTERHSRRCAWSEGTDIRTIAYSMLNLSFPKNERKAMILENSRKGRRIAPTSITLLGEEELNPVTEDLLEQLQSVLPSEKEADMKFWVLFALLRIYSDTDLSSVPKRQALGDFFRVGYIGEMLKWDDIHLRAQILCILYSLRILKQILQVSLLKSRLRIHGVENQLLNVLSKLPPLSILSDAGIGGPKADCEMNMDCIITLMLERLACDRSTDNQEEEGDVQVKIQDNCNSVRTNEEEQSRSLDQKKRSRKRKMSNHQPAARRKPTTNENMYDILQAE